VDPSQTYAIGGNERVVGQAELLWGVPGMERSVRLGLFFDFGQVYVHGSCKGVISKEDLCKGDPILNESVDLGLRYSAGLSFAWISPMGPLKFSYAVPFNEGPYDKIERFQFQLGTNF
jgi:outer membrane protein insertion porin family